MSSIFLKNENKRIFFTRRADNDIMAKKKAVSVQHGIRFPRWMYDKIQEIADTKGSTFTDVVLELLRQELAAMGHTMGIGREVAKMPVEGENPPEVGKAR
jgi:hypothetical protein